MSDPIRTMKHIIEALRMKSREPGIYREPGQVPRRVRGAILPARLTTTLRDGQNYDKYRRQQEAIGESAVSLDEWMEGR